MGYQVALQNVEGDRLASYPHPGLSIPLLTKLINVIDRFLGYSQIEGCNLPSTWQFNTGIGDASSTTELKRPLESYSEQESSIWKKKKSFSSWTTRTSTELPGRNGIVLTITNFSTM